MTKSFNDKDFEQSLAEQPAQQEPNLAESFRAELDKLSQRNYELRMENTKLRAQPAQRTWVVLTLEEIDTEWGLFMSGQGSGYIPDFVHAIEARLKEKNT